MSTDAAVSQRGSNLSVASSGAIASPGRFIFDLFHEVKREKKLDSYSLNFVSQKFLGAGKRISCFATAVVLDRLFTQVTRKST